MTKPFPSFVEYESFKYTIIRNTTNDGSPFDWVGLKPNSFTFGGNYSVVYKVQNSQFYVNEIGLLYGVSRDEIKKLPSYNGVIATGRFYRDTDESTS